LSNIVTLGYGEDSSIIIEDGGEITIKEITGVKQIFNVKPFKVVFNANTVKAKFGINLIRLKFKIRAIND